MTLSLEAAAPVLGWRKFLANDASATHTHARFAACPALRCRPGSAPSSPTGWCAPPAAPTTRATTCRWWGTTESAGKQQPHPPPSLPSRPEGPMARAACIPQPSYPPHSHLPTRTLPTRTLPTRTLPTRTLPTHTRKGPVLPLPASPTPPPPPPDPPPPNSGLSGIAAKGAVRGSARRGGGTAVGGWSVKTWEGMGHQLSCGSALPGGSGIRGTRCGQQAAMQQPSRRARAALRGRAWPRFRVHTLLVFVPSQAAGIPSPTPRAAAPLLAHCRPLIYSCLALATNRDVEDNRK